MYLQYPTEWITVGKVTFLLCAQTGISNWLQHSAIRRKPAGSTAHSSVSAVWQIVVVAVPINKSATPSLIAVDGWYPGSRRKSAPLAQMASTSSGCIGWNSLVGVRPVTVANAAQLRTDKCRTVQRKLIRIPISFMELSMAAQPVRWDSWQRVGGSKQVARKTLQILPSQS